MPHIHGDIAHLIVTRPFLHKILVFAAVSLSHLLVARFVWNDLIYEFRWNLLNFQKIVVLLDGSKGIPVDKPADFPRARMNRQGLFYGVSVCRAKLHLMRRKLCRFKNPLVDAP